MVFIMAIIFVLSLKNKITVVVMLCNVSSDQEFTKFYDWY